MGRTVSDRARGVPARAPPGKRQSQLADSARDLHGPHGRPRGVSKPRAATGRSRERPFEFETLKPNFPLFRGSARSDARASGDVGFFYFSELQATKHAYMHLRGNFPAVREFRPARPLKLFVMNRANLELLVALHPGLRETVRAVTGLGMERGHAYERHHLPLLSESNPLRCIAEVCAAVSGIKTAARTGLAQRALGVARQYVPGVSGRGQAAAVALATGAVAYRTLGLGKPRRANPDALEIHNSGFLSMADATARIIASKRLALDMRAVLLGVDGWVYTEPQARARSLVDPRFGKFQREVMLWEPAAKVRPAAKA